MLAFIFKFNWYKVGLYTTLTVFMSMFGIVGYQAYARKSGNTGLDMAKIQQMRYEANQSFSSVPQSK
ncbi:hypothetical protein [Parachlamydia acanthamoebae]|uniref:hypothetical protein n=1 Tax=Parachlamydia acanthamoebae TaxID=83552 RepID=UPI0007514063|nr:hypothetical protein [Parachlamydia acanthamoebae]